MKVFKKIFYYLSPIWSSNDGCPSLRAILAIGLTISVIHNVNKLVDSLYKVTMSGINGKSVDSTTIVSIVSGITQTGIIIGLEVSLIVALLSLRVYQTIKEKQEENK